MQVPISYGPAQKFLSRIQQDPNLDAPAIVLPRMAFEIRNIQYDGTRKLPRTQKITLQGTDGKTKHTFVPVPYNIDIELSIMAKYLEDGYKILEQIVPYFTPDWTIAMKILDGTETPFDIPVVLQSTTLEDTYESDYSTRRSLIWTLTFTMKVWFFGPDKPKKLIKFIHIGMHDNMDETLDPVEVILIQPGLTANGTPTTKISETIPWQDIEIDDDWGTIVRIEDYPYE